MSKNQENKECTFIPEQYNGSLIKDVTLFGGSPKYPTHIDIRLTNGKYIEIIPSLSINSRNIAAQLEVSRGGWLEGGKNDGS